MNSPSILFFAAALAAGSTCSAAPETLPKIAYTAAQPGPCYSAGFIKPGTSRDVVISMIGEPAARLSTDIWVYWDYRSNDESANRLGYDTLLVTFVRDRVSGMKMVNGDPIRSCLAVLQRRAAERYAANKP